LSNLRRALSPVTLAVSVLKPGVEKECIQLSVVFNIMHEAGLDFQSLAT
jgi:hypothetical protein